MNRHLASIFILSLILIMVFSGAALAVETVSIEGNTFKIVRLPANTQGNLVLANDSVHTALPAMSIIESAPVAAQVAINGLFFNAYYSESAPLSFPDNCPLILTNIVLDGQMEAGNLGAHSALIFTTAGQARIEWVESAPTLYAADKDAISIWTVNGKNSSNNSVILITDSVSLPYQIPAQATAYLIKDNVVSSTLSGGQTVSLAKGEQILAINPGSMDFYQERNRLPNIGDVMRFDMQLSLASGEAIENVDDLIGGGRLLILDGQNVNTNSSYNSRLDNDPKQAATGTAQRSFVAILDDGSLILGTGNGSFAGISSYLMSIGAVDAMSLDGGASSLLYENGTMLTSAGRNLASIIVFGADSASANQPEPSSAANLSTAIIAQTLVDGLMVEFPAYNIEGNNYIKLRDLAFVLNESSSQFSVDWDEAEQAISLTGGQAYTAQGQEMAIAHINQDSAYQPSKAMVFIDGIKQSLTAYTINGNNYYKLRDLGDALGFAVDWDESNRVVIVNTR